MPDARAGAPLPRIGGAFVSGDPAGVPDQIWSWVDEDVGAGGLFDSVCEDNKAISERVQFGVSCDFVPDHLVHPERAVEDFSHWLKWRSHPTSSGRRRHDAHRKPRGNNARFSRRTHEPPVQIRLFAVGLAGNSFRYRITWTGRMNAAGCGKS